MTFEDAMHIVLDAARQTASLNATGLHTDGVAQLQNEAILLVEKHFCDLTYDSLLPR